MKIITSEREADDYGDGEILNIRLEASPSDNEELRIQMSFGHGEPEDNYLFRDLNDAYSIQPALVAAYEAGKRGEKLELVTEEIED
jgi:hypothetical protein